MTEQEARDAATAAATQKFPYTETTTRALTLALRQVYYDGFMDAYRRMGEA